LLWETDFPWEIVRLSLTAIATAIPAVKFIGDGQTGWGTASIVVGLLLFAANCGLAYRQHRAKAADLKNAWLEPVLLQLFIALKELNRKVEKPGLRVCLHFAQGEEWEQLTEYVGDPYAHIGGWSQGLKGRRFPKRCGATGLAFRFPKKLFVGSLPADRDLSDYLAKVFNYTASDLRDLRTDRRSWAAVLVGRTDERHAVIFCDAAVPDFFGPDGSCARRVIIGASRTLARHLRQSP
jgi:hypothetical protein